MKVLLIQPPSQDDNYRATKPLMSQGYLASSIEHFVDEVKILDLRLKKHKKKLKKTLLNFKPDVVGISLMALTLNNANKIMGTIKRLSNSKIIAGGPEVTLIPEKILKENKFIDYILVGESDISFREFILKLKNNKDLKDISGIGYREGDRIIIKPPKAPLDLDKIPFPAWHLYKLSDYDNKKKMEFPILTSRGCPFNCAYCSSPIISNFHRERSTKNVVDEIEYDCKKFGAKNFQFLDDTFGINPKRIVDICDEIIRRKLEINWLCSTRVDRVNRKIFEKMKEAGCHLVSMGIESSHEDVLKTIHKSISKEQIKRAFKDAKLAGLRTKAFFIVGLPNSTYNKEIENIKFFKEIDIDIPRFANIIVLPRTELYHWVKKNAKPLIDLDDAHNISSETMGTAKSKDKFIKIVYETEDFTKEERIKAFNICNYEADKWVLKKALGQSLGKIAFPFSRISFLRRIGEGIITRCF